MTDSAPRISVIMAVYNGGPSLDKAVRSVLVQTFADFEFIIINDGSTDGTQDYLNRLAQEDERIRVIHQENQGLTRSLITGCSEARGQYIARQDADDMSLPHRLERQVDALERSPESPLATSWIAHIGPDGQVIGQLDKLAHSVPLDDGTCVQMVGVSAHSGVLFRRDAYIHVGGYRSCFYYAQDCDLWLRLAALGRFQVVQEVLLHAAVDLGSISSCFRSYQSRFTELAESCFRARLADRPEEPYLEQAAQLANEARTNRHSKPSATDRATSLMLAGARTADHNRRLARRYYWQALRSWPFHLRTWKALVQHAWVGLRLKSTRRDVN